MEENPVNNENDSKKITKPTIALTKKTIKTKIKLAFKLPWLLSAYVSRTWFTELKAERHEKKPKKSRMRRSSE